MTEDIKGFLVYFVTKGPEWGSNLYDNDVWQVQAQVSADDGETVRSMVFTFDSEENALQFKRDVNSKMEPTRLGEEDG